MSTSDRIYQNELIEQIILELSTKRKCLVQSATGSGKTHIFTLIAQRFTREYNQSVLILVHRKELVAQAQKTVKRLMGIDACLITSKTSQYRVSRVYIGMIESTVKRLSCFGNVGLVIIDECHMANFNKVHSLFLTEFITGFTATPISSSKREPLNKFYNAIVTGPQICELIKLGFLAQNITRCPKDIVDYTQFEVDNRKGDYNEGLMAAEYKKPHYVTNVFRNYLKYCKGKKTIIFNVNIEHSQKVTEFFVQCGVDCRHIDSNDDTNRDETLKWFKETENAVMCNVGIATTGFDEPTIQKVITNFSTLSLNKAIQCWGRGGRIIDQDFIDRFQVEYPYQLIYKDYFEIIDLGGNYARFGDWNNDRKWDYMFHHPDIPGDGIAPMKTCPECEGLVHAALSVCNLKDQHGIDCAHVFDKKKRAEEMILGEMILVTQGINVEDLINKNSKKHDYFTFEELGEKVVRRIFREFNDPSEDTLQKSFTAYYHLCKEWWKEANMVIKTGIKDISISQFHINKARFIFDSKVTKFKETYEKFNNSNCRVCGEESDLVCDECNFPVCELHNASEHQDRITCANCITLPVHQLASFVK